MDFLTIIYTFVVMHVFSAFLLFFLYLSYPKINGTKQWCIAGFMHGLGGLLTFLRGEVPDIVSISIANTLFFFGYANYLLGLQRHFEKNGISMWAYGHAVFFSIPFFVISGNEYLSERILISSIGLLAINIFISIYCIKFINYNIISKYIMAISFFMVVPFLSYRMIYYIIYDVNEFDYIATAQLSNKLVLFVGALQSCVILMGLFLLISQRLQEQLISNLHQLNAQADEKSRFLAMITHEIKTPLSVIKNILSHRQFDPKLKKIGLNSVDEIDQIINASNSAVQVEVGDFSKNQEKFKIFELIFKHAKELSDERAYVIDGNQDVCIMSDKFLINVVLYNVIQNAFKYSDPGYPVEIFLTTKADDAVIILEVKNVPLPNGWPDKESIFQKYYRAPISRTKSGSGLGLYIVKGFMGFIGGVVDYVPTDKHVVFRLEFPVATIFAQRKKFID